MFFLAIVPINKYLSNDYRTVLRVPDSPQDINTEIPVTPVVVVNNGLPRPTTSQRIRTYTFTGTGASTTYAQIATPSATTKIYFLGVVTILGGVGCVFSVYDATTGAPSTTTGGTANFVRYQNIGATSNEATFTPLPVECVTGLRAEDISGGSVNLSVIYYLEETVL